MSLEVITIYFGVFKFIKKELNRKYFISLELLHKTTLEFTHRNNLQHTIQRDLVNMGVTDMGEVHICY